MLTSTNLTPGKRKVGGGAVGSDFDFNFDENSVCSPSKKIRFARTNFNYSYSIQTSYEQAGRYSKEPSEEIIGSTGRNKRIGGLSRGDKLLEGVKESDVDWLGSEEEHYSL